MWSIKKTLTKICELNFILALSLFGYALHSMEFRLQ